MRDIWWLSVVCVLACDDEAKDRAEAVDAAVVVETDGRSAGCGSDEACNGRDDDCDGVVDEGVLNACGACGATPIERCDYTDNDCDGVVDEGERNRCGECGPEPAEECNGEDDDCDLRTDEGVLNACETCGPVPEERCDGEDNDCDGETDEGVRNDCGECGAPPEEVCNGADEDCDGNVDEGVSNRCGGCGPVPEEICDEVDNDCDGTTDEGVLNACDLCGEVPDEVCDFADNDCDGLTDEGLRNGCGGCAPVAAEVCNGIDDDCDGATDEGVANPCGECGAAPEERCNFVDDDCDGEVDELNGEPNGLRNACGECGVIIERCDGIDNDCDRETDEGLLNACGRCGELPVEVCNGRDDDCDGEVEEGLPLNRCGVPCVPEPLEVCNDLDEDCDGGVDEDLPHNACGVCGPLPEEVCDGADNDCDNLVDEGHALNACGGCGDAPREVCNGEDDDCDGGVDEDFRVGRSIDDCAGCGDRCSRNNASPECVAGGCVVIACDEGFRDLNQDAGDGCEAEAPPRRVVFVDDDGPEDGNGEEATPFPTIVAALAEGADVRIVVRPGSYPAAFRVEAAGVSIEADDDVVVSGGNGATPTVAVVGDHSSVAGLRVDGRAGNYRGISLGCRLGCAAVDNEVVGFGGTEARTPAYGIEVLGGDGVRVVGNVVSGVVADQPNADGGAVGYPAAGIRVRGLGAVVSRNVVERVRAGRGERVGVGAAMGGTAAGIWLDNAPGATLTANSVRDVQGGIGGNATLEGAPGAGGPGYGMLVEGSSGTTIDGGGEDVSGDAAGIERISGRAGGTNLPAQAQVGTAGAGVGISIRASDNIALHSTRIANVTGGSGRAHPTNPALGSRGGAGVGMRFQQVTGLRVTGANLTDVGGGTGGPNGPRGQSYGFELLNGLDDVLVDATNTVGGDPAYVAIGVAGPVVVSGLQMVNDVVTTNLGRIVVVDVRAPVLTGNRVVRMTGAAGDPHPVAGQVLGDEAVGIRVSRASGGAVLRDNHVEGIVSGAGMVPDAPAHAVGVLIVDCDGPVQLQGNSVLDVRGGAGVDGGVTVGDAFGVVVRNSTLVAANTLLGTIAGGSWAAGVRLENVRLADIFRSTTFDIGATGDPGHAPALHITPTDNQDVRYTDAIVEAAGYVVRAEGGPVGLAASHIRYRNLSEELSAGFREFGAGVLENEVSCLVGPIVHDFRLRAGSDCVNAGDPGRPCEVDGVACVPDIGYHAGTANDLP